MINIIIRDFVCLQIISKSRKRHKGQIGGSYYVGRCSQNRSKGKVYYNVYFPYFLDRKINLVTCMKYKRGNNRPSSVNQKSLVHNHDKAVYKCYTQDNKDTQENRPGRSKLHLMWPRSRREIKSITSHIRGSQIRCMLHTPTED